jgi:lipid-A-disaccharide synthase-like uncharacterized protein
MNFIDVLFIVIMLLGETLSLVFGMSNLVIWVGIFVPQIYKNYTNNCSKAISYLFYYKLLIGGIISLSIALIKQTNITIIYVGVHHLIITTILMSQLLYYRIKNHGYVSIPTDESNQERYYLSKVEIMCSVIITPVVFILLVIVYINRNVILMDVLAWVANILFTTSKFTQIYKNYKKQSTEGLSQFSFVCMIFTDLFFLASIL